MVQMKLEGSLLENSFLFGEVNPLENKKTLFD